MSQESGVNGLRKFIETISTSPSLPDNRSREEVKQDYDDTLAAIEEREIKESENFINELMRHPELDSIDELIRVRNCLELLRHHKDTFEHLNGNHVRSIELKRDEKEIEAAADLREKWRTFWFRVLGSGLLIFTLFALGTINHHVDTLHLPFENVLKTNTISSPLTKEANLSPEATDTADDTAPSE